jgi:hypothetical protein
MAFVTLTIFKVLICLAGFGFSAYYFFPAIKISDTNKMKKAGIVFVSTLLMMPIITAVEFTIIAYK